MPSYVRFAALGDSATYGIGDPVADGWRGWARLLAEAMGQSHDVSFCNLAVTGATAPVVRRDQLDDALAHRPDLASLIVGVNDTMRSSWDPVSLREDLLTCAEALHGIGAVLITTRFHDHGAVLGLPGVLRRPLWRRIEQLNAVYDEILTMYGGVRLDLAGRPEVDARAFWSVDRLHPSELGHRRLANGFGGLVNDLGLDFPLPSLTPDGGRAPTRWQDVRWMVTEGAPWMGRRAKDLAPWAARMALTTYAR